jgi:hypothetical protein
MLRLVLDWIGYVGGVLVLAWMAGYTAALTVFAAAGL